MKKFFLLITVILSTLSGYSQCSPTGSEGSQVVLIPTTAGQTTPSNQGVGGGSERIYQGFTPGNSYSLVLNNTPGNLSCRQARFANAANAGLGAWFNISSSITVTSPVNTAKLWVRTTRNSTHNSTSATLTYRANTTVTTPVSITGAVTHEDCPVDNDGSISSVNISNALADIRYVKLIQRRTSDNHINLAELRAYGVFGAGNVALGATVTSNVGAYPGWGFDGLTDGNTGSPGADQAHTGSAAFGNYVQVDLGSGQDLDYIQILNRNGCCYARASNLLLELFNSSGKLVYSNVISLPNSSLGTYTQNVLDVSWSDGATTLNRSSLTAGTYTLNYSDVAGNSGSKAFVVNSKTESTTPTATTSNATICVGGNSTLTASGGVAGTGSSVNWYTSSCGGTFVGSGNSIIVSPTSTTTYYARREGDCNNTSCSSVSVTVLADPTIPIVTTSPANLNVCVGQMLTVSSPSSSGGIGTCYFEYRYSLDGGVIYSNWSTTVPHFAATGTSYNEIQTRKVCSGSGCVSHYSSSTWYVSTLPVAPIIAKNPNSSIVCEGETLTITSNGGGGGNLSCNTHYRYSTDNGSNWSLWSVSLPSFTAVTGTNIVESRRACGGPGCGTVAGNTVSWTVVADPTISIVGAGAICPGENKTLFSLTSGGTGTCTYQWQIATAIGGPYTDITGATSNSYNTGALTATRYYQVQRICSGNDCNTATSVAQPVLVKTLSTAPTSATADSYFICEGDILTLTVTGGSLGTGADWKWYVNPGLTIPMGSGSPLSFPYNNHSSFYVRAEGDCNTTTSVGTPEVIVNGIQALPSPVSLTNSTSSSTCEITGGNNTRHFFNSNGDLLASINPNGQNLGEVTVTIEVGNSGPFGTGLAPGVCGYPGASGGEYVLGRNWDITVENQPSSPVTVFFHYNDAELTALSSLIAGLPNTTNYINCWGNVTTDSDLMMTVSHSDGSTELFSSLSILSGIAAGVKSVDFPLSNFSSGKLHSNGGIHGINPLPVELLSFEARPINNEYIELNWSTVTEINNEGFELLRSTDGTSFEKIAWIEGNGNTTQKQTYTYDDKKVSIGTYYYKLRQIDFDGEAEEFKVISVVLKSKIENTDIVVRPIPTSNTITIDIEAVGNSNTVISVYNYAGQRVLELKKEIFEGKNSLTLEEVKELSSGIYYINLNVDSKTFTKKFVVFK